MSGKTLAELIYEVDALRKYACTVDEVSKLICISWQEDGTLTYFGPDGWPACYYAPWTDFADNIEDFTSLERFILFLEKCFSGEDMRYLLTAPVWQAWEDQVKSFNALLGDLEIDL